MEGSHISWTDNTHNEWVGCTKVSAGCDNCYAERLMDTRLGRAKWGKGAKRVLTSEANRRKPFAWQRKAKNDGQRIKVFAQSLSDNFDEEVPDSYRDGLFRTIWDTPDLDWLMLTKRMAKMLRYLGASAIPPNAWWGCSVEDQKTADQRIPELLKLRALLGPHAILWLSIEPLIGEIVMRSEWLAAGGIDWVVVGGESGPAARPMHPAWARSLRAQCVAAGIPFHFKQWGEWAPSLAEVRNSSTDRIEIDGEVISRVGKAAAGRTLDGRTWDEFPRVTAAE